MDIATLNALDRDGFAAALDGVFEHTPDVVRRAWEARPFAGVDELVDACAAAVRAMGDGEQLALLRAHPLLGSRQPMAALSTAEQQGAALDRLGTRQDLVDSLNARYIDRFTFPFIVAVAGLSPDDVLDQMQARLNHDETHERSIAVEQVVAIGANRLRDRVTG